MHPSLPWLGIRDGDTDRQIRGRLFVASMGLDEVVGILYVECLV